MLAEWNNNEVHPGLASLYACQYCFSCSYIIFTAWFLTNPKISTHTVVNLC